MENEEFYKQAEDLGGKSWRRFWEKRHKTENKIKSKEKLSLVEAVDSLNYLAYIWDFKKYCENNKMTKLKMEFPLWNGMYDSWVNSREKIETDVNILGYSYKTTVLKTV